jgi:hypothetical protein
MAWTALGVGGALGVTALAALGAALLPLVTGGAGVALGAAYLLSPAWRLEVVVDDDGLEVRTARARRFRLAWSDIVRVVASPSTHTCFIDGGSPERSLLVPGVGAPAPYDVEDKAALCELVLAHVDPSKVETVETLEALRGKP